MRDSFVPVETVDIIGPSSSISKSDRAIDIIQIGDVDL